MNLKINNNTPSSTEDWNFICEKEGNFVQSTHYDPIQKFYDLNPIYFEIYSEQKLVGGIKCFLGKNKRKFFDKISTFILQFGEIICLNPSDFIPVKAILEKEIRDYLTKNKIVSFIAYNFYGDISKLVTLTNYSSLKKFEFNVAMVDLEKNTDLLKSYNRNTKRNIKKAEEAQLKVNILNEDIDTFNVNLKKVYEQQNNLKGCPNLDFVKHTQLAAMDYINLCFCKNQDEILSEVLTADFGPTSYSWFGGTLKNDLGSGQLMYFELMKKLQENGFKRFYFGQIARKDAVENEKFSIGISTFKRGFNCEEIESHKITYILKPFQYKLWNLILNARKSIG